MTDFKPSQMEENRRKKIRRGSDDAIEKLEQIVEGMNLTPEQAFQMMMQIIATILYAFTVSTTWWFGTRPPKQKTDA